MRNLLIPALALTIGGTAIPAVSSAQDWRYYDSGRSAYSPYYNGNGYDRDYSYDRGYRNDDRYYDRRDWNARHAPQYSYNRNGCARYRYWSERRQAYVVRERCHRW